MLLSFLFNTLILLINDLFIECGMIGYCDRWLGTYFPLIPEPQHHLLIDEQYLDQYHHDSSHASSDTIPSSSSSDSSENNSAEDEEERHKKGFSLSRRLWHYLLRKCSVDTHNLWSSLSTTVLRRIAETVCRSQFTAQGSRCYLSLLFS